MTKLSRNSENLLRKKKIFAAHVELNILVDCAMAEPVKVQTTVL